MKNILIALLLCSAPRLVSGAEGFYLDGLKAGEVAAYSPAGPEAGLPAAAAEKKPAPAGPQYTVYNPSGVSSVTVASLTGLMWLTNPDDAGVGGAYNRADAVKACEDLAYAGHSDWRLPKPGELISIVNYNGPYAANKGYFLNPKPKYWTSAPPLLSGAYAWALQFTVGSMYSIGSTGLNYVRCAR